MNEACRPFREQLGSLALGHLDDAEATAVRAHLDGCAECRAEFRALGEVAAMLPLADPERLSEAMLAPPTGLGERVLSLAREERRLEERRRRSRFLGLAAAAVVIAVAVASFSILGPSEPALAVTLEPEPPWVTEPIHATLISKPWGTEIRVDLRGLPERQSFWVWLREADDDHSSAGSFTVVVEDGWEVVLASSLRVDEATGIGISNADDQTVAYGHLHEEE